MSICVNLRLFNKIGRYTNHTIPVDVSSVLPSGSLQGHVLYWSCRRTITEPSASISLNGIENPAQIYIIDPLSSVGLSLTSDDSTNLVPGAYYWQLDLLQVSGSIMLSYPAVGYGDIIFQPNMGFDMSSSTLFCIPSFVEADTSTGDFTVNLPAALNFAGRLFIIKADGLVGGHVIIVPDGSDTIDGSGSNFIMNAPYASLMLYSDGSNWKIVAE